jgi:hypothetical protein
MVQRDGQYKERSVCRGGIHRRATCDRIKLSKSKVQSVYHSANPISFPSQAHQINSSSSSLTSVTVVASVAAGWGDMLLLSSSRLFWHVTRTPSVFTPAIPRRRCVWPSPVPVPAPINGVSPRPESTRKSRNMLSSVVLTFCRGSHAGCEKRRGARSNTWVCVGAGNRV